MEHQVEETALALVDEARAIRITSEAEHQEAWAFLRTRCKAVLKAIADTFDPIVQKAFSAHKEAVAQRDRHAKPVQEAERVVKAAIASYTREREAEQRRELEARRKEAQRLAEEEALAKAVLLESQGRTAEAEKVIEQPRAALVMAPPAVPKVEGGSVRAVWSAQVTDFPRLVQAAAANPALLYLLQPNQVALNQMARAQKEHLSIPGVVAVATDSVAAR